MRSDIFKRRLVSLSRMFQGVDVCAAVYYDEQAKTISIATNQNDEAVHPATQAITNYLSNISSKSTLFRDTIKSHLSEAPDAVEPFKEEIKNAAKTLQKTLIKISEEGERPPFYHETYQHTEQM